MCQADTDIDICIGDKNININKSSNVVVFKQTILIRIPEIFFLRIVNKTLISADITFFC